MKITRSDGTAERVVLIGMITDTAVCGRIAAQWEPDFFTSKYAALVGGWCVKYFRRYNAAPAAAIEPIYAKWADKTQDKATREQVQTFLASISDEYENEAATSPEYVLDLAAEHFSRTRLRVLGETIQDALAGAVEVKEAEAAVEGFARVELGGAAGIDPWRDESAVRACFQARNKPLITYPGALGEFFGSAFERDAFVSFMAPEKRGKTWWLLDVAYQAVKQHRRVAFFEVGDMSQNQIMARLMVRTARRPWYARKVKYPKTITRTKEAPTAIVTHDEREYTEGLTEKQAWDACQAFAATQGPSPLWRLSTHPNDSINVAGVQAIVDSWARGGWVADFVVIDYADILAAPAGVVDPRERINDTWKQLRALSQKLHCCVVTATQSDAASYHTTTLDRSNFSGDKRKLAHVTAMFGINATEAETEARVQRLNAVVMRESEFFTSRCVHVAGCLDLGRPAVISTF